MRKIKFTNQYVESNDILEKIDAAEKAVRFANRWLNNNVNFAEAIAAAAAITAQCRWAAVSRLKQGTNRVDILALIDNGVFVDCFSYEFNQTPCEEILGQEKFCHFREVQHSFPEDEELTQMGVADYAGCSFKDRNGKIAGHIFVMHDKPMENIFEIEKIITTMISLIQLEWPD